MSGYPHLDLRIGGERVLEGRDTLSVTDPATGEEIGRLPIATAADLDLAIERAVEGFASWRKTSVMERYAVLRRTATLLRERVEAHAAILTREQGKPLAQAKGELSAAADYFDWYAEEARRAYGRLVPPRANILSAAVLHEPVGPVAAFAPWNFPASQIARKLAPAFAAGCSCVLKPAEETPGTALAIADTLADAGLPAGVLSVVFGDPAMISSHLIASPAIRKISFTGSTAVGRLIARQASDGLKRVTLELGGHAPVLVFDDADVDAVAKLGALTKIRNAGQICISPTRFLVQDAVHDRFVARFQETLEKVRVGNGFATDTDMGPLANPRRGDAIDTLIEDAVVHGATHVTGGARPSNAGLFRTPALLTDVPTEARAMQEEPFGPLALVRRFDTVEDGLREANRLPYALAAYAFTQDRKRVHAVRENVEAGMIGLNGFAISWPETPFGGLKDSGYGSEGGYEGLEAYLTTKLFVEAA